MTCGKAQDQTSRIVLHGSRGSPFVEKVYCGLMLKRLPFEVHEHELSPLGLRKNATTGKMPALELGGRLLFDSTLILHAVERHCPEPPLFSADPLIAAQQSLIEDWADESLYWYGMSLRWNVAINSARWSQFLARRYWPVIQPIMRFLIGRHFGTQTYAQGMGRLPTEILLTELDRHLASLTKMLGPGPFLFGLQEPSVADLAVYGQIRFIQDTAVPEGARILEGYEGLSRMCRLVETLTT